MQAWIRDLKRRRQPKSDSRHHRNQHAEANDPRVKQAEADQIVKAMNAKKIPVTYVLFHDEGHGFMRPENRFAFYAVTEGFLAKNLGGRYEPIGDAFGGADFSVPSGKDDVPGLAAALKAK